MTWQMLCKDWKGSGCNMVLIWILYGTFLEDLFSNQNRTWWHLLWR